MTAVSVEWDIFKQAVREAEDALDRFKGNAYGAEHHDLFNEAKSQIKECTNQIKAVEEAIQELPSADERNVWRKELAGGRKEVKELEREMRSIDSEAAKRARLFDGMKAHLAGDEEDPDGAFSLRAQAEGTARMLHNQKKSLNRSEQVAVETEQMGLNTLNTLRRGREQMLTTIDKTDDLQEELQETRATVTGIRKVMVYNRLTQMLIIIFLTLGITLTVYFRWMR